MRNPEKIFKIVEVVLTLITAIVGLVKKSVDQFPSDDNEVDEQ